MNSCSLYIHRFIAATPLLFREVFRLSRACNASVLRAREPILRREEGDREDGLNHVLEKCVCTLQSNDPVTERSAWYRSGSSSRFELGRLDASIRLRVLHN